MVARAARLEIITRTERRRRYSDAEKVRIVSECVAAGASVAKVAARYEVSPSLLYSWRSQVREGKLTAAIASADDATMTPLAPVDMRRQNTPDFIQLGALRVEATTIRASLPGGIVVDFPADLDPARVAAVIGYLRDGGRQ